MNDEQSTISRKFELTAALLLGIAALMTAYGSLRAAMLGGEELEGFTLSSQYYNDSNSIDDANIQTFIADQALFLRYVEAAFANDVDLATYMRENLFEDQLIAAIDWWEQEQSNANPPESPFEEGSPYKFASDSAAENAKGDAAFDVAKRAGGRNDRFDQATALLSITLFAVGLAILVRSNRARVTLAALAIAGLVAGGILIGVGELG